MKNIKNAVLMGVLGLGLLLAFPVKAHADMPAPPGDPTYEWFVYAAGNYITGALLMFGDSVWGLF